MKRNSSPNKFSAMEMLGIRKSKESKSEKGSDRCQDKNPITDEYRKRKIKEREEEKKYNDRKYEEVKKLREIDNLKN